MGSRERSSPVRRDASPNKRERFPHEACRSCAGVWGLRPKALPDGFVEAHVEGGCKYLSAIPGGWGGHRNAVGIQANKNCV